jgi:alanine dehydrogenase
MGMSFGFPRMHVEPGERRDFLPCLMAFLDRTGSGPIVLEDGYGEDMGLGPVDYIAASPKVRFGTADAALDQDVIVVLRCPTDEALRRIRAGSTLVSMLHYATRPERTELIASLPFHAVSLDGITDDVGRRLVENFEATAWNGVREAFRELSRLYDRFHLPSRRPLRVSVLGAGAVGAHAVRAATRYGDTALRDVMVEGGVPGVEVTVLDFDLTWNEPYMLDRLERTDMLVDATQRPDPTRPVVPNDWIAVMPLHAVLLDLSADPYDLTVDPPKIKGIEGIPHGSLATWLFHPDHPAYDLLDPRIRSEQRRMTLSCNAWPGLEPRSCMEVYSRQVQPVLRVLLETPIERLDADDGPYERSVARAEVSRWRAPNLA